MAGAPSYRDIASRASSPSTSQMLSDTGQMGCHDAARRASSMLENVETYGRASFERIFSDMLASA